MRHEIPLEWQEGVPVLDVDGRRIIINTGSPATIGSDIKLCNQEARPSAVLLSMMGERFLPEWAEVLVDSELLRQHRVTFAPTKGKLFLEPYS